MDTSYLDRAVERAVGEDRIVGTVLLVRQGGRSVYERAHGLADREAGKPMTIDTIFRLSSVTKPIVAATILALVEAGQLKLTDLVTDHLPAFKPRLEDGTAPPITIHHLLTHTSGLSSASILTADEEARGINRWHLDTAEILRRLAALPLLFAPGTGWSYGPSIDVLGVIAGQLAGGTLDDSMRRYVTGPLGMSDTGFAVPDRKRLAAPYADGSTGPELMVGPHAIPNPWGTVTRYDPERIFDPTAFQSGGGGARGTGSDIMTLLEALRTGGAPILQAETVRIGLDNQTAQLAQSQSAGWQFSYFGAWLSDPSAASSPAAMGTNRWGGIYGHNWFIDPVNELTVVSMSNTGLEGCDGAYRDEIRDAVYQALA